MDHHIRFALHQGSFDKMLSGEVGADETFIGGLARNMHKEKRARKIIGTGGKDKTMVMGILERGGEVRTKVVSNRRKKALQAEVRAHVEAGSVIFTDALKSYEFFEQNVSNDRRRRSLAGAVFRDGSTSGSTIVVGTGPSCLSNAKSVCWAWPACRGCVFL